MELSYEAFLEEEFRQLKERLLQKHDLENQTMDHHRHRHQHQQDSIGIMEAVMPERCNSPQTGAGSQTTETFLDAVVRRPSTVSNASSFGYDITGFEGNTDKWARLVGRYMVLCETHEWDEGMSRHDLRLHPAWTMSHAQALRLGQRRKSTIETVGKRQKTLRFNDVFTDASSWLQALVLPPDHSLQLAWACLAAVLIIFDMIVIPMELFPLEEETMKLLDAVSIFTFSYWLLDAPLHVIFGVRLGGAVEMRPVQLGKLYLKSWLLIDLAVICVDVVLFAIEATQEEVNSMLRSGRFVRILRLVRLLRLLRVAKLQRKLMAVANYFLSAYALMGARIGFYLMLMLSVNHIIACFWYGVGSWTSELGNWMAAKHIDSTNVVEAYVAAMHWSLCQFTPSTNPIAPANAWERFFAIWVILLAMACFSSFLGSIGAAVNSMRMAHRDEMLKHAKLERFFMERKLSVQLFDHVKSAIRRDQTIKIRMKEEEVSLMTTIPERLKKDLHREMYMDAMLRIGIWMSGTLRLEDREFITDICHIAVTEGSCRMAQDMFLPRTVCHCVYVLQDGLMEYNLHHEEAVECERGELICLPVLWAEWDHCGRLSGAAAVSNYITIDSQQFCKTALLYGGQLSEYLKVLGLLIVQSIGVLQEDTHRISDLFDQSEVKLSSFTSRAYKFSTMRGRQPMFSKDHSQATTGVRV
mmetsp:Transcript_62567/g.146793  ORF Transcript_62567/g.146793 Transcript_62567/m.146793 type:complete len:696 (-) Transcript_62567:19-2106(-)